jgi:hypothetical protein
MILIIKVICSIFLLYVSLRYLFNQYNYRSPQKTVKFYLLFLVGSIPLIYVVFVDTIDSALDGSGSGVDHGVIFYLTWIVTMIIIFIAFIFQIKNKRR